MAGWSIKNEVSNASPEGSYRMRVDSVEAGTSKSSGEPMLFFKTTIVSGDFEGKTKRYFRSFQPKALVYLAKDLANSQLFDLDSEEANDMPTDVSDVARMLDEKMSGKVFLYENIHGEYNGQKQDGWTLVGPAGSL